MGRDREEGSRQLDGLSFGMREYRQARRGPGWAVGTNWVAETLFLQLHTAVPRHMPPALCARSCLRSLVHNSTLPVRPMSMLVLMIIRLP